MTSNLIPRASIFGYSQECMSGGISFGKYELFSVRRPAVFLHFRYDELYVNANISQSFAKEIQLGNIIIRIQVQIRDPAELGLRLRLSPFQAFELANLVTALDEVSFEKAFNFDLSFISNTFHEKINISSVFAYSADKLLPNHSLPTTFYIL